MLNNEREDKLLHKTTCALYAAVIELRKLLLLLLTPLALPGFGDALKSLMGTLCHPVTSGIGGNSAGP